MTTDTHENPAAAHEVLQEDVSNIVEQAEDRLRDAKARYHGVHNSTFGDPLSNYPQEKLREINEGKV